MSKQELFARKCDITGKGMNEGYCFREGEMYFSEKEHLVKHLRDIGTDIDNNLSDDEVLNIAYEEEEYYYTTWKPDPINEECYDKEGNKVSNW